MSKYVTIAQELIVQINNNIQKGITKLQNLKTAMMQKMFCFGMTGGNNE